MSDGVPLFRSGISVTIGYEFYLKVQGEQVMELDLKRNFYDPKPMVFPSSQRATSKPPQRGYSLSLSDPGTFRNSIMLFFFLFLYGIGTSPAHL